MLIGIYPGNLLIIKDLEALVMKTPLFQKVQKMQNKTVCISGVSRGLGRALSLEFDYRGWQISGCSRSEDALSSLSNELSNQHHLQKVDVTKEEEVRLFAENTRNLLGCPSIILNNAGVINRNAKLTDITTEEFTHVLKTNVLGTHLMIRSFLPDMERNGVGLIANFSSYWGQSTAPEVAPYCASKWAVEGLSRALSQEVPVGITVVAFNPGVIDTEMLRSCFGEAASSHEKPNQWAKHAVDKILQISAKDSGSTILG